MASLIARIAGRSSQIRAILPWVAAPVAVVVGFIGYNVEDYFRDEKKKEDNMASIPKYKLRELRQYEEMQADLAKTELAIDAKPSLGS
eukprot:m.53019 g.53019  ORF g.53019 m.53019 type:complete len:88 (-) comp21691_c0_seq1:88-351(-)